MIVDDVWICVELLCSCLRRGGVLSADDDITGLTISGGSRVVNNSAFRLGGAFISFFGSMQMSILEGSVIGWNAATETHGGAVYAKDSLDLSLEGGSTLRNNNAGVSGGAVYCSRISRVGALQVFTCS